MYGPSRARLRSLGALLAEQRDPLSGRGVGWRSALWAGRTATRPLTPAKRSPVDHAEKGGGVGPTCFCAGDALSKHTDEDALLGTRPREIG